MDNNFQQNQTFNLGNMNSSGIPVQPQGDIVNPFITIPSTTIPTQSQQSTVQSQQVPINTVETQTAQNINQEAQASTQVSENITTAQSINNSEINNFTTKNKIVSDNESTEAEVNIEKQESSIVDKFIVNVGVLQRVINQAKIVGNNDPHIPLSQTFYLVLNDKGLYVAASNTSETIEVIDRSRLYSNELKFPVEAKKFSDLIAAIDSKEDIEIVPDEQQDTIKIYTTSGGQFSFASRADESTGLSITINPTYVLDETELVSLDYNLFMDLISGTKSIRANREEEDSRGIYFGDLTISTDSSLVLMKESMKEFANKEFFIRTDFLDIIYSLNFNVDSFKFGYIDINEDNLIGALILSDGNITLSGPVTEPEDMHLEDCRAFWAQKFPIAIEVNTQQCSSILKRVLPFIGEATDKDSAAFNVQGNTLIISVLDNTSYDKLMVNNPSNVNITFNLPIKKLYALLQVVTTPTFNYIVDPNTENYICLQYANMKCIIGAANNE